MTRAQFLEFRTHGTSDPASDVVTRLGPATMTGRLLNAMQLHFRLDRVVDAEHVRWRRTLEEQVWEAGRYASPLQGRYRLLFAQRPETEDHPPEGLGMLSLPDLYDIDLPGIAQNASERKIPFSGSNLGDDGPMGRLFITDNETTDVVWIIDFIQWVEVLENQRWRRCSNRFRWFSNLRVIWDGRRWRPGPGCEIGRGSRRLLPSRPPGPFAPVEL